MKNKITALAAALLVICLNCSAQIEPKEKQMTPPITDTTMGTPKNVGEKITEFMKNKLDLTNMQEQKVEMLNEKLITQVRKTRTSELTKEQKHTRMKKTMTVYDTDLKKILNPDQYKKYLALKKDVAEHFKEMRADENMEK